MEGRVPPLRAGGSRNRLWLMGQGLAQESEGGGNPRSCWKQQVELQLEATFCQVPCNPLFLGYVSAVAKLN